MMTRLKALVLQRCPCCLAGRAFFGLFKMKGNCSECGLRFEPEPGYYAGALYISYAMGLVVAGPMSLWMMFRQYSAIAMISATILVLAPLSPIIFRYSRLMWIYIDVLVFDTKRCRDTRLR